METIQSAQIGDRVSAKPFTDCFGESHARVSDLYITGIQPIPAAHGLKAYRRLTCEPRNRRSLHLMEASERFFEPDN